MTGCSKMTVVVAFKARLHWTDAHLKNGFLKERVVKQLFFVPSTPRVYYLRRFEHQCHSYLLIKAKCDFSEKRSRFLPPAFRSVTRISPPACVLEKKLLVSYWQRSKIENSNSKRPFFGRSRDSHEDKCNELIRQSSRRDRPLMRRSRNSRSV